MPPSSGHRCPLPLPAIRAASSAVDQSHCMQLPRWHTPGDMGCVQKYPMHARGPPPPPPADTVLHWRLQQLRHAALLLLRATQSRLFSGAWQEERETDRRMARWQATAMVRMPQPVLALRALAHARSAVMPTRPCSTAARRCSSLLHGCLPAVAAVATAALLLLLLLLLALGGGALRLHACLRCARLFLLDGCT